MYKNNSCGVMFDVATGTGRKSNVNEMIKRPRGRPRKHPSETESSPVQALDRGLSLLRLLAAERGSTLSDLAMQAGVPTSTAHRLLSTLQSHRFAEFDETTQNWMIGVEAYRIGSGFLNRINLVEAAQPIMQGLVQETGETANLAIVDDGEVIFVRQVESPNPIRAFFRPGTRSQMHASGAGKALLAQRSQNDVEAILQKHGLQKFTEKTITKPADLFAELERIHAKGWSFDDEERYVGMSCVAAAVFGTTNQPVAAISVSGPSARFSEQNVAAFSAVVRNGAAHLTKAIGG